MESTKDIFLKDTIKFKVPVKGSDIEITASGNIEDLDFFKEKTIKCFEQATEKIRHANQKLTEEQVHEIKKIRKEKGWGRVRLSRKFNVGKTTIERILNGDSWKDID